MNGQRKTKHISVWHTTVEKKNEKDKHVGKCMYVYVNEKADNVSTVAARTNIKWQLKQEHS